MSSANHRVPLLHHPAIYTDYYELTMAQGYFLEGRQDEQVSFDYFFRKLPYEGGYAIFAGLTDVLELLDDFQFSDNACQYLRQQGFHDDFLTYLSTLSLSLNIHAAREGEVVFPTAPIVRVEGSIVEAQIVETLLLNILNFETLIATKARRMCDAAADAAVLDFGLRRAQGLGGMQASKAAIIGGASATSNVLAAYRDGLPASGTMAHSWIQSFGTELEAFRAYARHYPNDTILLVDTYDTLQSGLPNAITVAKELANKGHALKAIRLDSGDLAYLSRKARAQLDEAGLQNVKIAASNQLDEYLIKSLINQSAPIDVFGVGTRLVTGHHSPALDGVYKLAAVQDEPTLKISENVEKITLPGRKNVQRYTNAAGYFVGDGILMENEDATDTIYHPHFQHKKTRVSQFNAQPLLQLVMKKGNRTKELPTAAESAAYAKQQFARLSNEHKRFDNPHIYKVGISKKLLELRNTLTNKMHK